MIQLNMKYVAIERFAKELCIRDKHDPLMLVPNGNMNIEVNAKDNKGEYHYKFLEYLPLSRNYVGCIS